MAPVHSFSDKRGMNNKAIKSKLLCFIHGYKQTTCEMIKYFASLIRGDATCKYSKSVMLSWWWPVSLKHRYWVQIEAECVTIRFYLLMKAKNVMNAKNNKFYFFLRFKALQCMSTATSGRVPIEVPHCQCTRQQSFNKK